MTEADPVLPRIALFQPDPGPSIFEILGASSGLCRIIWVVGWLPDRPSAEVNRRFGDSVDLAGLNFEESIAKVVAAQPDGIAVLSDAPIELAAEVAQRLGLPFHSVRTAQLLCDKLQQRAALRAAGLPVPGFAAVQAGDQDVDVRFPAVLKPRAGAGSRDTFKVHSLAEATEILASCDPNEEFILEEWLSDSTNQRDFAADLVSVESIVRNGAVEHLMVTGRFPFALPFRETGSFMPSDLNESDKESVREVAELAIHALDIRHGVIHTEVKMTLDGPRIVEVNGRLGGSIHGLVAKIGGPSMLSLVFQVALGIDKRSEVNFDASAIAFYRLLVGPTWATKVDNVEHLDDVTKIPGVLDVIMNRQPGDEVNARLSAFTDNTVRVDGLVHSYDELLMVMNEIDNTLVMTFR
jgi:biotin carboxylase